MKRQNLQPILLSILSGLLLIFSYPTYPYGIFAWIALVPLFIAIENQSFWKTAQLGFITGFIYFYGILYWLNVLYQFSWMVIPGQILLSCYLSMYIVLFVVILNWLFPNPGYNRLWFSPILWISIEYFRQIGFLGFSWGILGYTQWQILPIIQIADITSVLGISFLIVLVNAGIAYLITTQFIKDKPLKLAFCPLCSIPLLIIPVLLVVVYIYGLWQIRTYTYTSPNQLKVALVQGNIPQDLKWDEPLEKEHQEIHFRISETAAQQTQPDLIVWPETAITEFLSENPDLTTRFQELGKKYQTQFLIGSPDIEPIGTTYRLYNSAIQVVPGKGILNKYNKIALVPFSEYLPLSGYFPWLKNIIQAPGDFDAGNKYTQFELYSQNSTKWRFATIICFESTMSHLVRRTMLNPADFLIIITNDAWFGKTEAPYQHAYMAIFRAIENRTYIARAANTGYSCFINPVGKIVNGLNIYHRGYLADKIQDRKTRSVYTRYGDIFAYLCLIITLLVIGREIWCRKKRQNNFRKDRG